MSQVQNPSVRTVDFPVEEIRRDFPILQRTIHGKPLIYFDNAATTQKPLSVMDRIRRYYAFENANVNRGVHFLSEQVTREYEMVREQVQAFLNSAEAREIIFVRGTTEAVNLVAQTYGRRNVAQGDEILITTMEHHSNIVPWQILCEEKGARLRIIPISDRGELIMEEFKNMLNSRTKLVSIAHVSNVLGTVNPIEEIVRLSHANGTPVFVDGAQAAPHFSVDVQRLDCDFYAFSGHKIFGSTGTGVLYGKAEILQEMPPYQGGGDMISSVTFEKTTYNTLPHKFEAGTPNIEGVLALGAALEYVQSIGLHRIHNYELELLDYATRCLLSVPGIKILGESDEKASVISFVLDGVHPHDIGTILDSEGIAIRAGHHCAMPLMQRFGIAATARVSLALYNTKTEIEVFVKAIDKVKEVFA